MRIYTLVSLSALCLTLLSCHEPNSLHSNYGRRYTYNFTLAQPARNSSLNYSDSNISIVFTIDTKTIRFSLTNKRNEPLRIPWDEASIVVKGNAERPMHKGVKYSERTNSQPLTTVPPGASLSDFVLPVSNVYYDMGIETWSSTELLETHDLRDPTLTARIESYQGTSLALYLPLKTSDGRELGYNFVFEISDVHCSNCPRKN